MHYDIEGLRQRIKAILRLRRRTCTQYPAKAAVQLGGRHQHPLIHQVIGKLIEVKNADFLS